jgi:hypothetical protein
MYLSKVSPEPGEENQECAISGRLEIRVLHKDTSASKELSPNREASPFYFDAIVGEGMRKEATPEIESDDKFDDNLNLKLPKKEKDKKKYDIKVYEDSLKIKKYKIVTKDESFDHSSEKDSNHYEGQGYVQCEDVILDDRNGKKNDKKQQEGHAKKKSPEPKEIPAVKVNNISLPELKEAEPEPKPIQIDDKPEIAEKSVVIQEEPQVTVPEPETPDEGLKKNADLENGNEEKDEAESENEENEDDDEDDENEVESKNLQNVMTKSNPADKILVVTYETRVVPDETCESRSENKKDDYLNINESFSQKLSRCSSWIGDDNQDVSDFTSGRATRRRRSNADEKYVTDPSQLNLRFSRPKIRPIINT